MPDLTHGMIDYPIDFDVPTLKGYDSDHPLARGQVGKAGVAIDCLEDLQMLFEDARLEEISPFMNADATAYILIAFYAVLARQQGADWKKIGGGIGNNHLPGSAGGSNYIYPLRASTQIDTDLADWCREELPGWKLIGSPSHQRAEPTEEADDPIRLVQIEKIRQWKLNRNPARVDRVLQELNDKASSGENIMPAVVEAVENRCTLGEIADTLREVFGEYKGV